MEKNRADFYNRIKDKTKVEGDATSGLIMASNKTGQQQNFDYWQAQFFGGEEPARRTLANLQKVVGQPNNWFDRLLTTNPPGSINHKDFLKDEKSFFQAYCCDFSYAKNLPACTSSNNSTSNGNQNQQNILSDYAGFYTGKDEKGVDQKQEIKVVGEKLLTSVDHQVAGKLDITLTPTTTKDVFNIEIKNNLIKSSSGTATFGRNKEGKVCNVTVNAKAKPTVGKEQSLSSVALKDGVSCDGGNVVPNNNPPQQEPNNQQNGSGGETGPSGFPVCVDAFGSAVNVYLVIDKSNNKAFAFAQEDDDAKAKQIAEKIIADNPNKQLELKFEEGRLTYVNRDMNKNPGQPLNSKLILFKDYKFVSDSRIKRGTYKCVSQNGNSIVIPVQRETIINESQAKKYLRDQYIRIATK